MSDEESSDDELLFGHNEWMSEENEAKANEEAMRTMSSAEKARFQTRQKQRATELAVARTEFLAQELRKEAALERIQAQKQEQAEKESRIKFLEEQKEAESRSVLAAQQEQIRLVNLRKVAFQTLLSSGKEIIINVSTRISTSSETIENLKKQQEELVEHFNKQHGGAFWSTLEQGGDILRGLWDVYDPSLSEYNVQDNGYVVGKLKLFWNSLRRELDYRIDDVTPLVLVGQQWLKVLQQNAGEMDEPMTRFLFSMAEFSTITKANVKQKLRTILRNSVLAWLDLKVGEKLEYLKAKVINSVAME